jgi:hypothetical protein
MELTYTKLSKALPWSHAVWMVARSLRFHASPNDPKSQWFVWISKACPHISLASTNSIANNDPKLFNICFKTFVGELVQWRKTKAKGKQGRTTIRTRR